MAGPAVLILHATGTNRDREAARACSLAGGDPRIVHVNEVLRGGLRLAEFAMLVIPGGFSFGDDLGAGKLWATLLKERLGDQLSRFVDDGKPVIGICNGFQVLVKSGLLPGRIPGLFAGSDDSDNDHASNSDGDTASAFAPQSATLTRNEQLRFECRWVHLEAQADSPCVFTEGLTELIHCPIAHGEGRFVTDDATLAAIEDAGMVALRYVHADGSPATSYPANPNGSLHDIAGITNARGNVLGLMPHPEDHVDPLQHPRAHRGERGQFGLPLFAAGVRYATQSQV